MTGAHGGEDLLTSSPGNKEYEEGARVPKSSSKVHLK
jgi:hypothetical protein